MHVRCAIHGTVGILFPIPSLTPPPFRNPTEPILGTLPLCRKRGSALQCIGLLCGALHCAKEKKLPKSGTQTPARNPLCVLRCETHADRDETCRQTPWTLSRCQAPLPSKSRPTLAPSCGCVKSLLLASCDQIAIWLCTRDLIF
jgi:hypothetical protein